MVKPLCFKELTHSAPLGNSKNMPKSQSFFPYTLYLNKIDEMIQEHMTFMILRLLTHLHH